MTLYSLALLTALQQNPAVTPAVGGSDWWMNRHNAIVAEANKGEAKIVFVGDSITHAFGGDPDTGDNFHNRGKDTWDLYYGAEHALNMGISGDRTQNALWRLDHGELGKCHPKVAVVMIGTNNTGSDSADQIAEGVEQVCGRIQSLSKGTKVLLLGIFPRGNPTDANRTEIGQINQTLSTWSPSHGVTYLDIGSKFVDGNGVISTEVMPDLLHPMAFGYRKWAMAMEPTLAKLMNRHPKTTLDPNNSAVVPVTQNRDYRNYDWMTRLNLTKSYAQSHDCKLAFIGDSINHFFGGPPVDRGLTEPTKVWQDYYGKRKAVDLGFGWDRTENVLWRLEQGELDSMHLKAVSLMIGTNNLSTNTLEEIRDGVQAVVDMIRVKQPRAQILLLGVFPRGEKPDDEFRIKAAALNKLIEPIGKGRNVTYMDFGAKFLEPDGTISRDTMGDFLHPTAKGYRIWGDAVEPWMRKYAD